MTLPTPLCRPSPSARPDFDRSKPRSRRCTRRSARLTWSCGGSNAKPRSGWEDVRIDLEGSPQHAKAVLTSLVGDGKLLFTPLPSTRGRYRIQGPINVLNHNCFASPAGFESAPTMKRTRWAHYHSSHA